MTASGGLYPSLVRYCDNLKQLEHEDCMAVRRLRDCLDGKKTFTRAEKKAISSNIAMKVMNSKVINYQELEDANTAWRGKFDEVYKIKEV